MSSKSILKSLVLATLFLAGLSAAKPTAKPTAPTNPFLIAHPDFFQKQEHGPAPFRWFPNNDAPDGINYMDVDSPTPLENATVVSRTVKRDSFQVHVVVCNQPYNSQFGRCSGECNDRIIYAGHCSNTPGTQCTELYNADYAHPQVCNRGCGYHMEGTCTQLSDIKQKFLCAGHYPCYNTPGTQSVGAKED